MTIALPLRDADRRTDAGIRNNRMRQAGGSGASVANAPAEGEAAGSGDAARSDAVLVSAPTM